MCHGTRGQFKGNWILPAVVLLWPVKAPGWLSQPHGRRLLTAALVLAWLGSAAQTLVLTHPVVLDRLESTLLTHNALPGWATYTTQAGIREKSVSSSRSWSNHACEYADASAFATQLQAEWRHVEGTDTPVYWIVASDYGLACQLHWYLGNPKARVAVYGDGILHRTWHELATTAPKVPLLALSVPRNPTLHILSTLPPVAHPVSGRTLRPHIVRWLTSSQEHPHVD